MSEWLEWCVKYDAHVRFLKRDGAPRVRVLLEGQAPCEAETFEEACRLCNEQMERAKQRKGSGKTLRVRR